MTTTCTGTRCAGLKFQGHILTCPNCGSSLLFYQGGKAPGIAGSPIKVAVPA